MEKIKQILKTIIDGTFLTKKLLVKNIPFILLLVFIAFFYITNRNQAEKKINDISKQKKEIRDLRSSSIIIASELMLISKQTEVFREIQERNLGLIEATEPPKILIIKSE